MVTQLFLGQFFGVRIPARLQLKDKDNNKSNNIMKTFKTFLKFIYILVISLLLLAPRIIVLALAIVEAVSRVMKNTTAFFIEQVKNEAYSKILENGKDSKEKSLT